MSRSLHPAPCSLVPVIAAEAAPELPPGCATRPGTSATMSADGWSWRGLAGEQQVFFLLGVLITDDDVEPYSHCVPEPAQGLEVRHAAAQLDAR